LNWDSNGMPKPTAANDTSTEPGGGVQPDATDEEAITLAGDTPPSAPRPRVARRQQPRPARRDRPLPPGSGPGTRIRATRPVVAVGEPGESVIPYRRPRGPVVLVGVVVVLLVLGLCGYGIVASGFFRVDSIDVHGASLVSVDDIVQATGALHQNLYSVDPEMVRQRVMKVAGIRSATVRRQWPRRLVVTVEERTPVAVWQNGGVSFAVDADGVVLEAAPDPSMVAIMQTDGASSLAPDDRVDRDAVSLALQVRDILPQRTGLRVQRFEWTQATGLDIVTVDGPRVRWGDSDGLDYKLATLKGILDQVRKQNSTVTEVDLRSPSHPFYR
jgi:cell division protein FtsQ